MEPLPQQEENKYLYSGKNKGTLHHTFFLKRKSGCIRSSLHFSLAIFLFDISAFFFWMENHLIAGIAKNAAVYAYKSIKYGSSTFQKV
jgi:hypothetical protein